MLQMKGKLLNNMRLMGTQHWSFSLAGSQ